MRDYGINGSSCSRVFYETAGIMENFVKYTEKHLRWSHFFQAVELRIETMLFIETYSQISRYFQNTKHRRCFINKVFLKAPLNLQENTCARVSF